MQICVLCKKEFSEYGNNPWPLSNLEIGQCCDFCNKERVTPARMALNRAEKLTDAFK